MPEYEEQRIASAVPKLEQDEQRPEFLPPEEPDHEWVSALEFDLASRVVTYDRDGVEVETTKDRSIQQIDPCGAYVLGYRTAIRRLRELTSPTSEIHVVTASDLEAMLGES